MTSFFAVQQFVLPVPIKKNIGCVTCTRMPKETCHVINWTWIFMSRFYVLYVKEVLNSLILTWNKRWNTKRTNGQAHSISNTSSVIIELQNKTKKCFSLKTIFLIQSRPWLWLLIVMRVFFCMSYYYFYCVLNNLLAMMHLPAAAVKFKLSWPSFSD